MWCDNTQPMYHENPSPIILGMLVQLHNLQVCHISLPESTRSTDDDLRGLRGVWPFLQKLRSKWGEFHSSHSTDQVSTFNGVIDFIWDHPHLEELKLTAADMSLLDEFEHPVYCQHSPRILPEGLMVAGNRVRDPTVLGN